MKLVDKGIKFVKDFCNDDETCVMIVFVVIGFMLCYLFKNQISGFANLGDLSDMEHSFMEKIGHPIEDTVSGPTQDRVVVPDRKPIGIELKPRKPEPTPSMKTQLQVMAAKPPVERGSMAQQVPGLLIQDASIFKPFDEVWNPGFMPLDMVFKGVPPGPGSMGQMGPKPMGPKPMGPKPMGPMGPMGPDRPMRPSPDQGGSGAAASEDVSLVLLYAPWCGHSKKMLPDYERVKSEFHGKVINGKKINVLMYDSDVDKDKVKEYGVKGFPSLFLEKDGKRESFPHRTYDKIADFLNNL